MSPASYLTAPPRVAGSSIAPSLPDGSLAAAVIPIVITSIRASASTMKWLPVTTLLASPNLAPRPDFAGFPPTRDSGRRFLRFPSRAPFLARREERERDDRRAGSPSRGVRRASVAEDGVRGVGGAQARGECCAAPAVGRRARGPPHGAAGLDRLVRVADRGVPAEVTRVAAVDLGTNTTRLLV